MNMKKLMAGVVASALAVTSLATVGVFADDAVTLATFAEFSSGTRESIDHYDVAVPIGGNIKVDENATADNKITLNIAEGTSSAPKYYFYFDRSGASHALTVSNIRLQFVFRNVVFEIKGVTDGEKTEWIVDQDATIKSNATVNELKAYITNNAGTGKIPFAIPFNQAYIVYEQKMYTTKVNKDTGNVVPDQVDGADQSGIIPKMDIANYDSLDPAADHLAVNFGDDRKIVLSNSSTQPENNGDLSLAVGRKTYTASAVKRTDGGEDIYQYNFYTEDVTHQVEDAEKWNSYRLTAKQQSDVRALKADSKITVTVSLAGTAKDEIKNVGLRTDLNAWRDEPATSLNIAKGANSITFEVPVNTIYDANYRAGYTSGFLAWMKFSGLKAADFNMPFGNANLITKVVVAYNPADVEGATEEKPGDDTSGDVELTLTSNGVSATASVATLTGNGGKELQVESTVTDTDVKYELHLYDANKNAVQPAGKVTLKLTIPAKFQGQTLTGTTVKHTCNDGTVEELPIVNIDSYTTDGYLVVETSKFSSFEFGFEGSNEEETTAAEPEAETTAAEPEAETTTEAPAENGDTDTNTGADKNQPTGVALAVIPAIVAAAGVVIAKKRG